MDIRILAILALFVFTSLSACAQIGDDEFPTDKYWRTVYNSQRSQSVPFNMLMYAEDSNLISTSLDTFIDRSGLVGKVKGKTGIYGGDGSLPDYVVNVNNPRGISFDHDNGGNPTNIILYNNQAHSLNGFRGIRMRYFRDMITGWIEARVGVTDQGLVLTGSGGMGSQFVRIGEDPWLDMTGNGFSLKGTASFQYISWNQYDGQGFKYQDNWDYADFSDRSLIPKGYITELIDTSQTGIYNGSGSITENRNVDLGSNRIKFTNDLYYTTIKDSVFIAGKEDEQDGMIVFPGGHVEYSSTGIRNYGQTQGFNIRYNQRLFQLGNPIILDLDTNTPARIQYATENGGLKYRDFPDWTTLAAESLVPKDYVDNKFTEIKGIYDDDADASANGVGIGEAYELSATNTYTLPEGLVKVRRN